MRQEITAFLFGRLLRSPHFRQDQSSSLQKKSSKHRNLWKMVTAAETAGGKSSLTRPQNRPSSSCFSSGPCKKRPGYDLQSLKDTPLGRSHRSTIGKAKLKQAIEDTKRILGLPTDYLVGIVPASDTGAVEMAMWNLLGPLPVDICHWESFGAGWYEDAVKHLKLPNVREFKASQYGELPDLSAVNAAEHDVIFTWNGTTSGVSVPNADWIPQERRGLVICDATSAVFAMPIPWNKIDVLTYSWQKVLGGEAAHGMLILSPRAVERLENYTPPWPLPKIFRLTKKNKLDWTIFEGNVINTVSMLCVEDYLDALRWAESIGGLTALIERSRQNLAVLERWVSSRDWIEFLAQEERTRSCTSVCLRFTKIDREAVKRLTHMLEEEQVAFDIDSYREAPPGIRIWCGATVEAADLQLLTEWIDWAYAQVVSKNSE